MEINADFAHDYLTKTIRQSLVFDESKDFSTQQKAAKGKLIELLGLNNIARNGAKENFEIESREQKVGYELIRFVFESEVNCFVPAYLLIPTTGKEKYPVAITLQGHKAGGMYNSIGITKDENDEAYQPRGAFALQAVKNGYAALCVELRGMSGELRTQRKDRIRDNGCAFQALTAIMRGRTVLGERCFDISRAIDLLPNFPALDTGNIIITGNSGGGTMSYYMACVDERIKLSAPSCAFCTYKDSILEVSHCTCNFIPSIYNYFEMQDLAMCIAPRKLVIIAGEEDKIFPIHGVKEGYKTVQAAYEKAGAKDNCNLITTPKGHYWCEDLVWAGIKESLDK